MVKRTNVTGKCEVPDFDGRAPASSRFVWVPDLAATAAILKGCITEILSHGYPYFTFSHKTTCLAVDNSLLSMHCRLGDWDSVVDYLETETAESTDVQSINLTRIDHVYLTTRHVLGGFLDWVLMKTWFEHGNGLVYEECRKSYRLPNSLDSRSNLKRLSCIPCSCRCDRINPPSSAMTNVPGSTSRCSVALSIVYFIAEGNHTL
ncbi:hypothetical protein G7K_3288-t1 [Saitoella complicata NRRL Y-17804]|uniref:Uncharacterized protein n=1 Tax=Saitoella complicata (strain BCRC 22490 / CBS 7301 / JCM 7358 / NBRC 10748 / NRRL Y-17804) TaxID=698492 RepID=A0A0E9NI87_SAICN|nr:hypothetical protein G7K_3288-t1 [Saitoella complicata NRRL Y-17804]